METPLIVEMVDLGWATQPPGLVIGAHLHPFYQFDVILAGELAFGVEGTSSFRIKGPKGLFVPPLTRHAYRSPKGFRNFTFKFYVSPIFWEALGRQFKQVALPAGLIECIEKCLGDADRKAPCLPQRFAALATLCLIEAMGKRPSALPPLTGLEPFRQSLRPLLEKIAEDPYAAWSIDGLAKECHLTSGHFARSFQKLFGQSPRHYLLDVKMRAATIDLLATPPRPIKEIAERARYATVHAFSHAFKKAFGVSPGEYRRLPVKTAL